MHKRDQYLRAHAQSLSWLERQLLQQISEYEKEWEVASRQEALAQRRAVTEQICQEEVRRKTQQHAQGREVREDRASQKREVFEYERQTRLLEKHQLEVLRSRRIAQERQQKQTEIARVAASLDERRQAALLRVEREAEELRAARIARSRAVDARKEAIFAEVANTEELRATTQEQVRLIILSFRNAIQQQRVRSVCDGDALRRHVMELLQPML
jgi:hypothetical protein